MTNIFYAALICDLDSIRNLYNINKVAILYRALSKKLNVVMRSTSLEKEANFLYYGTDPNEVYKDCLKVMTKFIAINNDRHIPFPVKHFIICTYDEIEYYVPWKARYYIGDHHYSQTIIFSRKVKGDIRDIVDCQNHAFLYKGDRIVYYVSNTENRSKNYGEVSLYESIYVACLVSQDSDIVLTSTQNYRFDVAVKKEELIMVVSKHIDDIFRCIKSNNITFYMIDYGDVIYDRESNSFYGDTYNSCMKSFRYHYYDYAGVITDSCNYNIFRDFIENSIISNPETDDRVTSKILYFINEKSIPGMGFDAKERTVMGEIHSMNKILHKICRQLNIESQENIYEESSDIPQDNEEVENVDADVFANLIIFEEE